MRRCSGMKNQRINVAERSGWQANRQGFHEAKDLRFISASYFKRKNAAVTLIFKQLFAKAC